MLQKNVTGKSLLEKLQVCIFAEIVFGVRCTLRLFFGGHFRGSLKHRENLQFFSLLLSASFPLICSPSVELSSLSFCKASV